MSVRFIFSIVIIVLVSACADFDLIENTPVGNPLLKFDKFSPQQGALRGDTITIEGSGFNPITYQNIVTFDGGSLFMQYVDESGVVRSDTFAEIPAARPEALVVSASSSSLRIIVPDNAFNGFIKVSYGIDTVESTEVFTLISTKKRPIITDYNPKFGSPGTTVSINGKNFARDGFEPTVDSLVVSLGDNFLNIDRIPSALLFETTIPSIPAGPADLRVGVISENNDTLYSPPVNFTVLPGLIDVPTMAWNYLTFRDDKITKGELKNGRIDISNIYTIPGTEKFGGISINSSNSAVYWVTNGNGNSKLYKGAIGGGNISSIPSFDLSFEFSEVVLDPSGSHIYLTNAQTSISNQRDDIRQFKLDNNGDLLPGAPTVIYKQSGSDIVNLKIVDNSFYWIDSKNKSVYTGTLNNNALENVSIIYGSSSLINPQALAVDESRNEVYISGANQKGEYVIYKGTTDGASDLTIFYEVKADDLAAIQGITDIEIDEIAQFIYWMVSDGIYRKKIGIESNAELTYPSTNGNYFDILRK